MGVRTGAGHPLRSVDRRLRRAGHPLEITQIGTFDERVTRSPPARRRFWSGSPAPSFNRVGGNERVTRSAKPSGVWKSGALHRRYQRIASLTLATTSSVNSASAVQLDLHPEAQTEIVGAADWYDQRAAGLGDHFLAEIDAALSTATARAQRLRSRARLEHVRRTELTLPPCIADRSTSMAQVQDTSALSRE